MGGGRETGEQQFAKNCVCLWVKMRQKNESLEGKYSFARKKKTKKKQKKVERERERQWKRENENKTFYLSLSHL